MKYSFIYSLIRSRRGSVIIALIVTVVILSALGASMVSLTSTSMSGLVGLNSSGRAYFLAESGFRYAESRYLNPGTKTKDQVLEEDLHDKRFTLAYNAGRFDLKVYPYFYKVAANPANLHILTARVPGGFPADATFSSGRLKIGPKSAIIYDYTDASQSGQKIITFTITQELPGYPIEGMDILPVAVSSNSSQIVNEGDSLQLRSGTANTFPGRNGTFQVNDHVYAYKENDLSNNRLLGISDPKVFPMAPLAVGASSDLILQKFIELHVRGEVGKAPEEGAASREIVYHVPLPSASVKEKTAHYESFDTPESPNWISIEKINFDSNFLTIDSPPQIGSDNKSLIRFDWSNSGLNLVKAHQDAGGFLSYDAQVKIGFSPQPSKWQFPPGSPYPELYAAGLSFRLDAFNRSYGVSLLRGDNSFTQAPQDGIPDFLVPTGSIDVAVSRSSDDAEDFFFVDLNNGDLKLTRNAFGFSQIVGLRFKNIQIPRGATITKCYVEFEAAGNDSEPTKLVFNAQDSDHADTFNTNFLNISNRPKTSATVIWNNIPPWSTGLKFQTPDLAEVIQEVIDREGWFSGNDLAMIVTGSGRRRAKSYDNSPVHSPRLHVEFRLDDIPLIVLWQQTSSDALTYLAYKWLEGFTIPENDETTLLVRIKEAAGIPFAHGSNNGAGIPIEDGDLILGPSGSAIVRGTPILDAGAWENDDASGTITINNISGFFSSGDSLQIVGSRATAQVIDTPRPRDNYIKVYMGTFSGNGTPNDNPLDDQRRGILRGEVQWPPDLTELTDAGNDFYRLIQWDVVNPELDSNNAFRMGSGKELNSIIRSNIFTTCSDCTFSEPELGLHAMGNSLNYIYFDDFAVQTEIDTGSPRGFVQAIQE